MHDACVATAVGPALSFVLQGPVLRALSGERDMYGCHRQAMVGAPAQLVRKGAAEVALLGLCRRDSSTGRGGSRRAGRCGQRKGGGRGRLPWSG